MEQSLEKTRAAKDNAEARLSSVEESLTKARAGNDSADSRLSSMEQSLEKTRAAKETAEARLSSAEESLGKTRAGKEHAEARLQSVEQSLEESRAALLSQQRGGEVVVRLQQSAAEERDHARQLQAMNSELGETCASLQAEVRRLEMTEAASGAEQAQGQEE